MNVIKKCIIFIILGSSLFILPTSCAKKIAPAKQNSQSQSTPNVNAKTPSELFTPLPKKQGGKGIANDKEFQKVVELKNIDLDLTKHSATMVYTEVFNMMVEPESFEGKVIKMKGLCSVYTDEEDGLDYYSCIILDATACCAQGVEFRLNTDYAFPNGYPAENQEIEVTGIFHSYLRHGYDCFCLSNAILS